MTPKPVRTLLIGSTGDFCRELAGLIGNSAALHIARTCTEYPETAVLERILHATGARLLFLDASNASRAEQLAAALELYDPNVQVVAVGAASEAHAYAFRSCGAIREFISWPLRASEVAAAIERRMLVISKLPAGPDRFSGRFHAFVPAKAGSGASTLAANTAAALAQCTPRKTLLSDLDFWSGVVAFRHRLEHSHSLASVLERITSLDEDLWISLVAQTNALDLLPGAPLPAHLQDLWAASRFFDFVRQRYDHVLFDCSGELDNISLQAMAECESIFLVCTQELDSLHVARAKLNSLRRLELDKRVKVLVNRYQKQHSLGIAQVSDLLGTNVELTFTNDYKSVVDSLKDGKPVRPTSPLGRQFQVLAERMRNPAASATMQRRFELFKWLHPGKQLAGV